MEIIDGFTYIALSAGALFSACELHCEAFYASGLAYLRWKKTLADTLQDRHVVSTDEDVKDVFVECGLRGAGGDWRSGLSNLRRRRQRGRAYR